MSKHVNILNKSENWNHGEQKVEEKREERREKESFISNIVSFYCRNGNLFICFVAHAKIG
jgi:hypothetical protein